MDHEDKDSKTCVVKNEKYDTVTPEEFVGWRFVLSEQLKNHGYSVIYNMVMNKRKRPRRSRWKRQQQ
jgi:hypothetical protein